MSTRVGAVAIAAGVAIVAAHAALLPAWLAATERPAFEVRWSHGLVGERAGDGVVAAGVAAEVRRDGGAPGLVLTRYAVRYRGGIERAVVAPMLVGPFQDPAAPPCTGRLAVGQRVLDGGDGTVAAIVAREVTAELNATEVFAVGRFRRVRQVRVRWVGLYDVPFEAGMFSATARAEPRPQGYLRAEATVEFDRLTVIVVVGALPKITDGSLGFTMGVRAHVTVDNRALAWLVDRLGVDRLATRFARGQLDTALLSALGPPPPLPLPGGRSLALELCPDRPIEVVADRYAALPLRWRLSAPVGAPAIVPPRRGPVVWPAPDPAAGITIDLDLDGVNGLLYELWRSGLLDAELDRLDLAGRFNQHPTVATYLTLRLSPLRLALPPVVAPAPPDHLRLGVVAAVTIADGDGTTAATATGTAALGFAPGPTLAATAAVTGLDVTCAPRPGILVPCYGDVVGAIRDGTTDSHAALGAALTRVLTDVFVGRRLAHDAAPAALVIDLVRARTTEDAAAVRLELDAHLAAAGP